MSEQRAELVKRYLAGESMTRLSSAYGVTRKTGYKWVTRYDEEGRAGLLDRSRAPRAHGRATPSELVSLIVRRKKKHPHWGPKKIMAMLRAESPQRPWPSNSTASELLKARGLVKKRRRHRRVTPYEAPFEGCESPNDVWAIDFKGDFRLQNGRKCLPLTLQDSYSRKVLRAHGLRSGADKFVWPILESAFEEFGLPRAIRSDNGPPFATCAPGGLSRLSIRLLKLGIRPERIDKGKPQQNGRLERFHLTLLREAISPPASTMRAQQNAFDIFVHQYNELRPHEALGQHPPNVFYEMSSRRYPCPQTLFEYVDEVDMRKVRPNGCIMWGKRDVYLSETLTGEQVALERVKPELWVVRFGPVTLGHIDKNKRFRKPSLATARKSSRSKRKETKT